MKHFFIKILVVIFSAVTIFPVDTAHAKSVLDLPAPGSMIFLSQQYRPVQMRGLKVDPKNPLRLLLLVDRGQTQFSASQFKDEVARLSKYFLTCLTVPEKDLWVNLSPYERNRIAADGVGSTEMGKVLLEQDYLLKQITASSSFPEKGLGQRFWKQVYERSRYLYGMTNIPISTFNKVWIVPKKADVYVNNDGAFVVDSKLDLMMEIDYLALKNQGHDQPLTAYSKIYAQVFREIILPELRREVNTGKNFAGVRQVYDAMILATWYKKHLKDSILVEAYAGQNKLSGIELNDKFIKDKIFEQYLVAFKKRVFDYIREEIDPVTNQLAARKYVSGGFDFAQLSSKVYSEVSQRPYLSGTDLSMATIDLLPQRKRSKSLSPGVQDTTMLSKIRNGLTAVFMMALAGLSLTPSMSRAATFSPGQNGDIIATVESGDTLGGILEQMSRKFKETDANAYQASIFSKSLWGQEGVVNAVKVEGVRADGKLIPGNKLIIKQSQKVVYPDQAIERLTGSVVSDVTAPAAPVAVTPPPAEVPLAPASNAVTGALGAGLPIGHVDVILRDNINAQDSREREAIPTPVRPLEGLSVSSEDIDADKILQRNLEAFKTPQVKVESTDVIDDDKKRNQERVSSADYQPFIISGVLAIALALTGRKIYRWYTSKKSKSSGKVSGSSMSAAPSSAFNSGITQATVDSEFLLTSAEEEAGLADLRSQLSGITANSVGVASSYSSGIYRLADLKVQIKPRHWLDILGLGAGGGLLTLMSVEPISLLLTAIAIPLATRLFYALQVWGHEVLGHALPAAIVHPKDWKKALSLPNLRGNLTFKEWVRFLIPFAKPIKDPYVSFKAEGWKDALVRKGGIFATVVLGAVSIGLMYLSSLDSRLLLPFLGPMVVSTLAALRASLISDGINEENKEDKYKCGNYGVFWMDDGNGEDYPQWVRKGLDTLLRRLIVRGGQSAGQVMFQENDKDNWVNLVKVLKHKRGNNDLVDNLLGAASKQFKSSRNKRAIKGVNGHVRYATGGPVLQYASHPHMGPIENKTIYQILNDEIVRGAKKVIVVITHNGDNDFYNLLGEKLDVNAVDVKKFFIDLVHYKGELPPGDSPIISLQVHFHLTQGNWDASARYAHIMANHQNAQEAIGNVLTEKEEHEIGKLMEDVFEQFKHVLSRPQFRSPDKSLKDLWVTEDMAGDNPVLAFQFEALQAFKSALRRRLGTAQVPLKLRSAWNDAGKLNNFVDIAVEKFFTGDRYTATKEFASRAEGSYGLVVRTSLNDNGVSIYSRAQGMAVAYKDGENKFFSFASDPLVLQGAFGESGKPNEMIILDPSAKGELVDVSFSKESRNLRFKLFNMGEDKMVKKQSVDERIYPLTENNPYHEPLVEYQDQDNIVSEDIDQIPNSLAYVRSQWEDKRSFNRQSGDAMVEMFASRFVEQNIKTNSMYYPLIRPRVLSGINDLVEHCLSSSNCSDEQQAFLRMEAKRRVGTESFLARSIVSAVDQEIASMADAIAQGITTGRIMPDQLYDLYRQSDRQLKVMIDEKIKKLFADFKDNFYALKEGWEHEADTTPANDVFESVDMFISGYENSLWYGEKFKALIQISFPGFKVKIASSNKLLQSMRSFGINRRTIGLIFSKSGTTFPSLNQAGDLRAITNGNTFTMTGRIDSMVSLALGQRLRPEAEFSKRVFVTGNYYPAEAASLSEALLDANQIELVLFLVKRMRELFPYDNPFGLRASVAEIRQLEQLRDSMKQEAIKVIGIDEEGRVLNEAIHKKISKQGERFGKYLKEGFMTKYFWMIPFAALIYYGVIPSPVDFLIGSLIGLPDSILPLFDAVFTVVGAPYLFTLVQRLFNKRPFSARMGAPGLVIGDIPALHQTTEGYVSKLGANSTSTLNMDVHGGNPEDHFGARFAHRIRRGTLIVAGFPALKSSRDAFIVTLKQAKGIRNNLWNKFGFKGGADVLTIGRGQMDNKDVIDTHIDLGEQAGLTSASDFVKEFNHYSFDAFGRMLAYKVLFNAMYQQASQIRLKPIGKMVKIWNRAWTFPSISVHTTRSPVGTPNAAMTSETALPAHKKGGIDLDSGFMDLAVEESSNLRKINIDKAMMSMPIDGIVPIVKEIKPVSLSMIHGLMDQPR